MSTNDDSTIENRVYLFKDLAAAWLAANPGVLVADRKAAVGALADIAYACCVMSDTADEPPSEVADQVRAMV